MTTQIYFAVGQLLHFGLQLAWILIIARIVLSWIQLEPQSAAARRLLEAVYSLTDPPMDALRRFLPFLNIGGIDFSPIVLLFGLRYLDRQVLIILSQL